MAPSGYLVAVLAVAWSGFACAKTEVHYRLPWPDGLSFMIVQAPGGRITSHFLKSNLNAVDIEMPEGIQVLAAREGVVTSAEAWQGADPDEPPASYDGNFVRVRHADDSFALYAHLRHDGVVVRPGEAVRAGQLLGYSGATGDVEKPHLHFGVSRWVRNKAGWMEELSLPITFTVGVPPYAFKPYAALIVTPNYAGPPERPRFPSEARGPVYVAPRQLTPEEELASWAKVAAFFACGALAMYVSWKLSQG